MCMRCAFMYRPFFLLFFISSGTIGYADRTRNHKSRCISEREDPRNNCQQPLAAFLPLALDLLARRSDSLESDASSFMHAFSKMLVHFPLVPA